MLISYESAPVSVREDLVAAHGSQWARLARPGTWWTGAERVAIARAVRQAARCELSRKRKEYLRPSPNRTSLSCGWSPMLAGMAFGALLLAPGNARALPSPASFDHRIWDRLLREYVDDEGRVAYQCLATAGRSDLARYLDQVAAANPQEMSEQDELAFWINAYNAGIVAAILQQYSPETPLSRLQLFRWYAFSVAQKRRTPDEIEHEILRKHFHEPRIHFALVCAASGCPRLRPEAYTGDRLDAQLDDQARRFINDPARNVIDPASGRVQLSSLFEWFGSDFAAAAGSVAGFVSQYVDTPEQGALVRRPDVQIQYLPYDWTLNAQDGQRHSDPAQRSRCRRGRAGNT